MAVDVSDSDFFLNLLRAELRERDLCNGSDSQDGFGWVTNVLYQFEVIDHETYEDIWEFIEKVFPDEKKEPDGDSDDEESDNATRSNDDADVTNQMEMKIPNDH